MAGPKTPCINCGSALGFINGTPGADKRAVTQATKSGGQWNFQPSTGTLCDLYVCQGCGFIQLFAMANP